MGCCLITVGFTGLATGADAAGLGVDGGVGVAAAGVVATGVVVRLGASLGDVRSSVTALDGPLVTSRTVEFAAVASALGVAVDLVDFLASVLVEDVEVEVLADDVVVLVGELDRDALATDVLGASLELVDASDLDVRVDVLVVFSLLTSSDMALLHVTSLCIAYYHVIF